jgi:hypothetical protein
MHATQCPSVELQYGVRPPHMPSVLQGVAAAPALPPPGIVDELPPPGFVVPLLSPPPPGFVVPVLLPVPDVVLSVEPPDESPPLPEPELPPVDPAESLLPQPLIARMTPTVPTIT